MNKVTVEEGMPIQAPPVRAVEILNRYGTQKIRVENQTRVGYIEVKVFDVEQGDNPTLANPSLTSRSYDVSDIREWAYVLLRMVGAA